MKTVVITGSGRGLGLEMAKLFKQYNYNVVISDISLDVVNKSVEEVESINSNSNVLGVKCDVTNVEDVTNLISNTISKFNTIDIWINNAGVNQSNKVLWDLDIDEISKLIDIDLKSTITCCKQVMEVMIKQNYGYIYNTEGHGSNDNYISGLSLYGTSKRAITYYTQALAYEVNKANRPIKIGRLAPGIMITNFITNYNKISLDNNTKKIYNILGDTPNVVAYYLVNKIIHNTKNNVRFNYLTNFRAFTKFIVYPFNKKDYFNINKQDN